MHIVRIVILALVACTLSSSLLQAQPSPAEPRIEPLWPATHFDRGDGQAAELHIYERGRHGVGLAPADATLSSWSGRLADWMRTRGLLGP